MSKAVRAPKTYNADARERVLKFMSAIASARAEQVAEGTGLTRKAAQLMLCRLALSKDLTRIEPGLFAPKTRVKAGEAPEKSDTTLDQLRQRLADARKERDKLDAKVQAIELCLEMLGVRQRTRGSRMTEAEWGRIGRAAGSRA